jgi:hypothetical protein
VNKKKMEGKRECKRHGLARAFFSYRVAGEGVEVAVLELLRRQVHELGDAVHRGPGHPGGALGRVARIRGRQVAYERRKPRLLFLRVGVPLKK